MKREFQIFFDGIHSINDFISNTVTGDQRAVLNFGFSFIDGKKIGGYPVRVSDHLIDQIGGMVYGNHRDNLQKYRLEMIKTTAGKYYLFVKYNHIIGSRRVAEIDPASLDQWLQD